MAEITAAAVKALRAMRADNTSLIEAMPNLR